MQKKIKLHELLILNLWKSQLANTWSLCGEFCYRENFCFLLIPSKRNMFTNRYTLWLKLEKTKQSSIWHIALYKNRTNYIRLRALKLLRKPSLTRTDEKKAHCNQKYLHFTTILLTQAPDTRQNVALCVAREYNFCFRLFPTTRARFLLISIYFN